MQNDKYVSQVEKFKQIARDLECDEREEPFERKLKKVAKAGLKNGSEETDHNPA